MDQDLTLGIMGPGTGLGNTILYTSPSRDKKKVYILGSDGGHTDVPYIDDEVIEYIKFFQRNLNIPDIKYISL
jgi:glucokinase